MKPKFIFKNGPFAGQEIELRPGNYRIGRHPENDLAIEDASISGAHCTLEISGMGVVVEDLSSTNGCFLNGERFQKESLPTQCELRLGAIEIRVLLPEITIAVPDMTVPAPPPPNVFEDGTPACRNHADVVAIGHCVKCGETWCPDCVRQVGLAGGRNLLRFCPACDGKCEPLVTATVKSKVTLFGRLADTLLLRKK